MKADRRSGPLSAARRHASIQTRDGYARIRSLQHPIFSTELIKHNKHFEIMTSCPADVELTLRGFYGESKCALPRVKPRALPNERMHARWCRWTYTKLASLITCTLQLRITMSLSALLLWPSRNQVLQTQDSAPKDPHPLAAGALWDRGITGVQVPEL